MNRRFLADVAERAVKSFFQGYLVAAGVNAEGIPAADQLLTMNALLGGLAALLLSVATSVISKPVGNPESASVLPPQAQPPAPLPADPTLKPDEAPPVPPGSPVIVPEQPEPAPQPIRQERAFDPTLLSPSTLAELARLIQPLAAPPPPPPPPPPRNDLAPRTDNPVEATVISVQALPPPPVRAPRGLLDPNLVGGRDPRSEGNT